MKIKDSYILRRVADTYVVIPLASETVHLNGIINLNKSGAMLWHLMEHHTTTDALVEALLAEYEVSREEALHDVTSFIEKLDSAKCIEY